MTAVTRFFFRYPETCRTPAEIVSWWESRRFPYNVAVGAAGTVTFAATHLIMNLPPDPRSILWLEGLPVALAYGILANLCYTGGWLTEVLLRRNGSERLEPVGAAIFRYGFVFSIGLTLFPVALVGLDYVFRILKAVIVG